MPKARKSKRKSWLRRLLSPPDTYEVEEDGAVFRNGRFAGYRMR